jgi:molecular chaperone GrpE
MDAEMVDTGDESSSSQDEVEVEVEPVADVATDPASNGDGDGVEQAAEVVEHDIEALVAERDQYKDIALRLQADFENYRKRVTTQTELDVGNATGRIADALLPVLDACEAAFAHGVDGVEPIWSALMGALQRQGLEAMDLQGKPFDPALAEAVIHEPGDESEPVVSETLRTGYRWKGRVLRAAMVKVKG